MKSTYMIDLSPKSRGILYRLTKKMVEVKLTFKQLICNMYGFHKTKFNKSQFHDIILQYDRHLVLEDIDELFGDLDENKNQVVFFEHIVSALDSITEDDNPALLLNRRSKIGKDTGQGDEKISAVIEFKDILVINEEYLEVIGLFITEKDGFLTKNNLT